MMNNKFQKGGKKSVNIQTEEMNVNGITYKDAKNIALDVFQNNFRDLSEIAQDTAEKRAEEITEKFLEKLSKEYKEGIKNAQEPDFQYSLFTVQKEYARSGDEEIGDLLIDILVDRTKEEKRSLMQIVLNESLSIAPKLTSEQLSILSVIFLLKYTIYNGIRTPNDFGEYLDEYIYPYVDNLTKDRSSYQHLVYSGCSSISVMMKVLEKAFKEKYKGLFSKGFNKEQLKKKNLYKPEYRDFYIKCFNNRDLLQVKFITDDEFNKKLEEKGLNNEKITEIKKLRDDNIMNEKGIRKYLIDTRKYLKDLLDVWNKSNMSNMNLTSVGIAIGHANVKKQLGEFTDLSIWI